VQDIFDRIVIVGVVSIYNRTCREIKAKVLQSLHITSGAMRKKKLSGLSVFRAHHMDFAAITVALLAGPTSPKEGTLIPLGAWNAIMITDSNRKALNDIHQIMVERFPRVRSQVNYRQKGLLHPMAPPTEPAFAEHCGDIPIRFAHHAGTLSIAAKA
jgi:hypothetical protein